MRHWLSIFIHLANVKRHILVLVIKYWLPKHLNARF